MLRYVKQSW